MAKYAVQATYYESTNGYAEFPEGKSWEDVEDHYVKWDCLWVKFKGTEDYLEIPLSSEGGSDWKRPINYEIRAVDADGEIDWDNTLVDSEEA